jgi:hypothetical protein
VCPEFMPQIEAFKLSFGRKFYSSINKKHIGKKIFLSEKEYLDTTVDERKFNLSYSEVLQQIEKGSIDPNQFGLKM